MNDSGISKRGRAFILWTARLALLAFVVQLSALGHWHSGLGGVRGVEGSAAHVEHCHGAGDCATGGGAALAVNGQPVAKPRPPVLAIGQSRATTVAPQAAFIAPPSEPPQRA